MDHFVERLEAVTSEMMSTEDDTEVLALAIRMHHVAEDLRRHGGEDGRGGGRNYRDLETMLFQWLVMIELRIADRLEKLGIPMNWLIKHAVSLGQSTLPTPYAT